MSCKYNNCKHCGYKSECEIFKENAELKKDNEGYEKDNTRLVNQFNQTSAKLIKAKELLKSLIGLDVLEGYDIVEEAEQFISEVEK